VTEIVTAKFAANKNIYVANGRVYFVSC